MHDPDSLYHHMLRYLPTDDPLNVSFPMDAGQKAAYRHYAGDGIFRLSVGLEDLISDLDGLPA